MALSSPWCWCRVFERKTLFHGTCTFAPDISEEKVLRIQVVAVEKLVLIFVSCSPINETLESRMKSSVRHMLEVSIMGRPFTF